MFYIHSIYFTFSTPCYYYNDLLFLRNTFIDIVWNDLDDIENENEILKKCKL